MSSPITTGITVAPGVVLVAAGIRAAQTIANGYAQAAALRASHQDAQQNRATTQGNAASTGQAALEASLQAAEARLERLGNLAEQLGRGDSLAKTRPQRPAEQDPAMLAAYIRGLEGLADDLQRILLTDAACRSEQETAALDALAEYLDQPISLQALPSARLLLRIAHLGEIPTDIATLAKTLDATPPGERADLLATELRLRIAQHLEAVQKREYDEAAAIVIEQSLKDLGYEVEEVAHTLYVEGGMVHFQRPGWGNYMVRMRLDFKRHSANFNVIRAVDEGDNERSVRDHLAEDRWCSEFPALMQALEAKGVLLNVTRRVEPGDLPVQLVERSKLPHFAGDEEQTPAQALRAREMK
ncbi:hypothetical protein [Uliginosibacterium gangwonense]|uniref:hypothetical protein n=1 Tax=Uliginosibacterium gangwonense TaxID=392736 RepID=UPI00035CA986|nr:hypothetical protein [Uliginosibacterium gangwonense]